MSTLPKRKIYTSTIFLLFFVTSIIIGYRPSGTGTDTLTYTTYYLFQLSCKCIPLKFEPGIEVIGFISSIIGFEAPIYLAMISFFQILLMLLFFGCLLESNMQDKNWRLKYLAVSVLIISPFFVNLQINALRQGLSLPWLYLSLLYALRGQSWKSAFLIAVGALFHYSTLLFIPSLLIILLARSNVVLWLYLTVLLFILYVFNVTEILVKEISDFFMIDVYYDVKNYALHGVFKSGVRLDFAIFTLFPILWAIFRIRFSNKVSDAYIQIIIIYMALAVPFWLLGWANFSNRYILPAWVLIPILLFYDFLLGLRRNNIFVVLMALSLLMFALMATYSVIA